MSDPNRLWRRLAFWAASATALHYLEGLGQARQTLAWAAQQPTAHPMQAPRGSLVLHVVIPVLREEQHIASALAWFVPLLQHFPRATLTFVSTEREERERDQLASLAAGKSGRNLTQHYFPQLTDDELASLAAAASRSSEGSLSRAEATRVLSTFPTTADVIDDEISKLGSLSPVVRHVRYRGEGRKAAQVNAAIKALTAHSSEEYVAVYDIDSRPTLELLRQTADFVTRRRTELGELPCVIQQSAQFATQGAASTGWDRVLCRGAARVQTMWTLGREIPNLRRYGVASRSRSNFRGLAQTVGHGLLIRLDVFREVGGLPTFTVLDDLPFGYRLTVTGIPVDSLPATTTVPAAEYVSELLSQSGRWFQSYFDYAQCAAHWYGRGHGSLTEHGSALTVGLYRGMLWLLASPATALCVVLALGPRTHPATRMAAAAALWAASVAPVQLLARAEGRALTSQDVIVQSAETLAGRLLRSLGPWMVIGRWVRTGTRHSEFSPKSNRRASGSAKGGEAP